MVDRYPASLINLVFVLTFHCNLAGNFNKANN